MDRSITAREDEFVTAVKGKYKLKVMRLGTDYLQMLDKDDKLLLSITADEYGPVTDLFESARRAALNVDEAIDDIIG